MLAAMLLAAAASVCAPSAVNGLDVGTTHAKALSWFRLGSPLQPGDPIDVRISHVIDFPLPTFAEVLRAVRCEADVVIYGEVTGSCSRLADNQDLIITEYELSVVNRLGISKVGLPDTITVLRPGGEVSTDDGRVFSLKYADYPPLQIGQRFVIFLKGPLTTGAFTTVGSNATYALDAAVRILGPWHSHVIGEPAARFLAEVRGLPTAGCTPPRRGVVLP